MALEEAKNNPVDLDNRIMEGKIKDSKYPEDTWAKIEHVHKHFKGKVDIHFWHNLHTGESKGFKFKDN